MGICIGEMFLGFPSVKMDAALAKKTTAAYVATLQHLPLWAVERGCTACRNRDLPFPPNAGQLRGECERIVQPFRDEQAELRQILEAKVYEEPSEGERERVKTAFKTLLHGFGGTPAGRPQRRSDARDDPAEPAPPTQMESEPRPLPHLSEEALAMFHGKQGVGDADDV